MKAIKALMLFVVVSFGAVLPATVNAQVPLEAYTFEDPSKEALFRELINELRCPKCQNQSIADSDAPLAKDLRDRAYIMVQDGASKQEVVDFMVSRYGDFAYYRPPVRSSTIVLWLGPILVVLLGAMVILVRVRKRTEEVELTTEEKVQLAALKQTQAPSDQDNKS